MRKGLRMGRNVRAKKVKKKLTTQDELQKLLCQISEETGQKIICMTEEDVEQIKKDAVSITMKSAIALLEYNMIQENQLSPEQVKEQSHLMNIRADAIAVGALTWEEVYACIDAYKEEAENADKQ